MSASAGAPQPTGPVASRTRGKLAADRLPRFFAAACSGDVGSIQQLLQAGVPVDCRMDGVTALHAAAATGHPDVAQVLLAAGAEAESVAVVGAYSATPLHMALTRLEEAQYPDKPVLMALPIPPAATQPSGAAADAAAYATVALVLLKAGADLFTPVPELDISPAGVLATRGKTTLLQHMLDAGCSPDMQGAVGRTLLHLAAAMGNQEAVQTLLDHGAAVDSAQQDGTTALFAAAVCQATEVVQQLLAAGAAANAVSTAGSTVLHCLARDGFEADPSATAAQEACSTPTYSNPVAPQWLRKTMQLLVRHGADVDAVDLEGRSALHYAARVGNGAAAALLLEFGANVNAANSRGSTVLGFAVANRQLAVAHLLLQSGAAIANVVDGRHGALTPAVLVGDASMVQLLLQFGADPNTSGADLPVLLLAAVEGHKQVVQVLLDAGADTEHALRVAVECRHVPVVKVLLEHQGSPPSARNVVVAIITNMKQQQNAEDRAIFARLLLHLCLISQKQGTHEPAQVVRLLLTPEVLPGLGDLDRSLLPSALLHSWGEDTAEADAAQRTLAAQEQDLAAVSTGAQQLSLQLAAAQKPNSSASQQGATAAAAAVDAAAVSSAAAMPAASAVVNPAAAIRRSARTSTCAAAASAKPKALAAKRRTR